MAGLSGKPHAMWFPGPFWEATSVADFWSKWNLPVHYACFLLVRLARRTVGTRLVVLPAVLAIFVLMGLGHDIFVWLGTLGRRGFQFYWTIFFVMNGLAVIAERSAKKSVPLPDFLKKSLTFAWLAGSIWLSGVIFDAIR